VSRPTLVPRLAITAVFAGLLGVLGAACPSRDLVVQVTEAGADTLVVACESFRSACDSTSCPMNHFLCDRPKYDGGSCTLKDVCDAGSNPEWRPERSMGLQLLLLKTSSEGVTLENESLCLPLDLRQCIYDPVDNIGCAPPTVNVDGCITTAISTQVDMALAGGMSFPGFTNTDDVALVAAFFLEPGDMEPCEAGVTVDAGTCVAAKLTAVAGLAVPIGSSAFDITCASCQGGTHSSFGVNNAPCPVTPDACFLKLVVAALADSGAP
jgi:hypothetical protein